MPPSNEELLDQTVRRQLRLMQLANGELPDLIAILDEADGQIKAILAEALQAAEQANPEIVRREANEAIEEEQARAYEAVLAAILLLLLAIAENEQASQAEILELGDDAVLADPGELEEEIRRTPVVGRDPIEHLDDAAVSRQKAIEALLATALAAGLTIDDVLSQLDDEILPRGRRDLETIARTLIPSTAQIARERLWRDSGIVIELWVSVLDSRTTPVCQANSGATRPVGESEWSNGYRGPYPAHFGERSVIVPQRPGQQADIPTYDEWLKRQTEEVQDDALGPARAKLWREGKLDLDKFVNDVGRTLRLDEL